MHFNAASDLGRDRKIVPPRHSQSDYSVDRFLLVSFSLSCASVSCFTFEYASVSFGIVFRRRHRLSVATSIRVVRLGNFVSMYLNYLVTLDVDRASARQKRFFPRAVSFPLFISPLSAPFPSFLSLPPPLSLSSRSRLIIARGPEFHFALIECRAATLRRAERRRFRR